MYEVSFKYAKKHSSVSKSLYLMMGLGGQVFRELDTTGLDTSNLAPAQISGIPNNVSVELGEGATARDVARTDK